MVGGKNKFKTIKYFITIVLLLLTIPLLYILRAFYGTILILLNCQPIQLFVFQKPFGEVWLKFSW